MKRRAPLILILLLGNATAHAHTMAPTPACFAPHKPYQFTSKYEVEAFQRDVEQYKRCILEFVEEQQRASQAHRRAAEEAVEEWNRFVSTELR